eukprot:1857427-Pyramimonas_sp.AAC.1
MARSSSFAACCQRQASRSRDVPRAQKAPQARATLCCVSFQDLPSKVKMGPRHGKPSARGARIRTPSLTSIW